MGFSGSGEAELVPRLRFPEFRDFLSWKRKSLSELFAIGSGKDYKHLEKGKIPVYGTGGYMLSVDGYLHDGESVCIGRKGTIDKPMFLCGKFWTVDTLFYTHSFKNCLPKFIYFCFQNIKWLAYNEATGVPSLSKSIIEKIEIKIPALEEQSKISGCLSSIDDLIDAENKKFDLLKQHQKGLMQQLFPAEGEAVPKLCFSEFTNDVAWETKTIKSVCNSIFSGGTPTTTKKSYYGGKIPFIRSAEIDKEKTELFITQEGLNNSAAKLVKKGDVLIALYGANSGNVAISKIEGAINQAILCLQSNYSNPFIYHYFTYKKDWIVSSYIQGGQGNLSGEIVKSIELKFPKHLREQQKIADCLSSLDDLILLQDQKINALKSHKRGLMQVLFPVLD